jgi:hypothetical protein
MHLLLIIILMLAFPAFSVSVREQIESFESVSGLLLNPLSLLSFFGPCMAFGAP